MWRERGNGRGERVGVAREIRLAGFVLLAQAGALFVAAVIVGVKTAAGEAADVGRGLSDAAIALGGAVLLVLAVLGLIRLRPAARTPVIVLELLTLPIGYSLAFQAGRIGYGAALLLSALAVIYLLFTPAAREQLQR